MTSESIASPPPCVVLLVDQSAAMQATISGGTKSLAQTAATAINSLLRQLARQQFLDLTLVGYGSNDTTAGARATVCWSGPLAGRTFVSAGELDDGVLRIEQRIRAVPRGDGSGAADAETVEFPVWYESHSEGLADEAAGLELCAQLLREHTSGRMPAAAVPLVLHITSQLRDEPASQAAAAALVGEPPQGLGGILFQAHLGTRNSPVISFPSTDVGLPPGPSGAAFERTSWIPERLAEAMRAEGQSLGEGARGLLLDARLSDLIRFLGIARRYAEAHRTAGDRVTGTAPAQLSPVTECHETSADSNGASSRPLPAKSNGKDGAKGPTVVWIGLKVPLVIESEFEPQAETHGEDYAGLQETPADGEAPMPAGGFDDVVSTPVLFNALPQSATAAPHLPATAPNQVTAQMAQRLLVLLVDLSTDDPRRVEQHEPVAQLQAAARWLLGELATSADGSLDITFVCYGTGSRRDDVALWGLGGPLAQPEVVRDSNVDLKVLPGRSTGEALLAYSATARPSLRPVGRSVLGVIDDWIASHPEAAGPPMVLHFTQGVMNVDELVQLGRQLAELRSAGTGGALLAHFVITPRVVSTAVFPERVGELTDLLLQKIWECSSPLVDFGDMGRRRDERRALAVNASPEELLRLLPGRPASPR
jgi:hypothetical protein